MKRIWWMFLSLALLAGMALAQDPAPQPAPGTQAGATPAPQASKRPRHIERREIRIERGPGGNMMYFRRGGMGKWWKNADLVKELGISDAQVQQMEKIFQDNRLQLVDLKATLEKAEIQLEPMMSADNPNEQAVLAQIDRVAAARAELEKSNARMHLAIRRVLTADQWKKLQSKHAEMHGPMMMRHFELPAPPPDAPDAPMPPPPGDPDMD